MISPIKKCPACGTDLSTPLYDVTCLCKKVIRLQKWRDRHNKYVCPCGFLYHWMNGGRIVRTDKNGKETILKEDKK